MKRLFGLVVIAAIALALVPAQVLADGPVVEQLIAGQNTVVGTVTVESDGVSLYVTYDITEDDWYLTETQLYAGKKAPKKAAPGRFPYKHGGLDFVLSDAYVIPLAELGVSSGDEVYIAAHAVVQEFLGYADPDLGAFSAALPQGTVDMTVAFPGGDSYFNTTISGGGELDGVYNGFCVDTSRTISPGQTYTADVVSSYDPAAATLVDKPENLDLVNYIVNQGYVGQTSPSGGSYTYGDVQRAIWGLVDDSQSTAGLGSWSQARVDEILADALANGEGFVPECDGSVAVILNPIREDGSTGAQITIAQVTFAEVGIGCEPLYQDETAWASGMAFEGNGWAMYFTYTVH
jgi:hypothetical protein